MQKESERFRDWTQNLYQRFAEEHGEQSVDGPPNATRPRQLKRGPVRRLGKHSADGPRDVPALGRRRKRRAKNRRS